VSSVSQSAKRRAVAAAKQRLNAPASEDKRPVTLYLNRERFAAFQEIYGRKTSQTIDDMIAAVVDDTEVKRR
jgi:hypothetical protein